MGKRTSFERRARGFYPTPPEAVLPLIPHLSICESFAEPCAGDGALALTLQKHGQVCKWLSDIEPQVAGIRKMDVMDINSCPADRFITNTPWPAPRKQGDPTVSMALHLSGIAPTWLLLPADFAHNACFSKSSLHERCVKIVSIGRVSWMGNGVTGFENCAWYLFDVNHNAGTEFIARAA